MRQKVYNSTTSTWEYVDSSPAVDTGVVQSSTTAKLTTGPTAPASPAEGDVWVDTNSSMLKLSETAVGIGKDPEQGALDVDGDIYSNGEKVVTENNLPATPTILTGWGYVTGTGLTHASKSISYGHTFSSIPVVVLTGIGFKDGSNPTSIDDFGVWEVPNPAIYSPTTTGCSVRVGTIDNSAITSARRLGFTWIAIGT